MTITGPGRSSTSRSASRHRRRDCGAKSQELSLLRLYDASDHCSIIRGNTHPGAGRRTAAIWIRYAERFFIYQKTGPQGPAGDEPLDRRRRLAGKIIPRPDIDNATALHLQDRIGTVEPCKIANLLLLRADPDPSVHAYDTIETVFMHGRPIQRSELSARKTSAVAE